VREHCTDNRLVTENVGCLSYYEHFPEKRLPMIRVTYQEVPSRYRETQRGWTTVSESIKLSCCALLGFFP